MKKIHFDTLAIEVTRRCNMHCAHCMRGEAQNKDISSQVISGALKNVNSIDTLVFTGGEVTLNVEAIRETLAVCKQNKISVTSFYIVTNGLYIPRDFIDVCIDLYSYVIECGGEPDICVLTISKDKYHEKIPNKNPSILRALSFFDARDKTVDWDKARLTNLGRARNLQGVKKTDRNRFYNWLEFVEEFEGEIYSHDIVTTVTVDGDILCDCDYEYCSTDDIKIGSVFEENWLEKHFQNTNAKLITA